MIIIMKAKRICEIGDVVNFGRVSGAMNARTGEALKVLAERRLTTKN